jgi:hypothetical protein
MSKQFMEVDAVANELAFTMPDRMTLELNSPNAYAINADADWLKARIYLGALFRKHGRFTIEVNKLRDKSIILPTG